MFKSWRNGAEFGMEISESSGKYSKFFLGCWCFTVLCFYFHCNVTITTRATPPSASESYLFTGELYVCYRSVYVHYQSWSYYSLRLNRMFVTLVAYCWDLQMRVAKQERKSSKSTSIEIEKPLRGHNFGWPETVFQARNSRMNDFVKERTSTKCHRKKKLFISWQDLQ